MADLPKEDGSWDSLFLLATVAEEVAAKESADKVEKVTKNEKLKEKDELVLENKNRIRKIWFEVDSWFQKKKRSALNIYYREKKSLNVSVFPVQRGMIKPENFNGSGEGSSKLFEGFNGNENNSWNVSSIDQVQEFTITDRNNYGSDEGCSYNDLRLSREKTKPSKNVIQIPSPELPEAFKNAIRDKLNSGTQFNGEVMLVIEKNLSYTDTTRAHNRLSLPAKQVKRDDFLEPIEYIYLKVKKHNRRFNHKKVKIIEPSLEKSVVDLRYWETNSHYALTGTWHDLVTRNKLEEGDFVQLWAFKIAGELCFALSTVPSRKIPKKEKKNQEAE